MGAAIQWCLVPLPNNPPYTVNATVDWRQYTATYYAAVMELIQR
jgi:hypothetical protein